MATSQDKILFGFKKQFTTAEKHHKKLVTQWEEYHKAYLGTPRVAKPTGKDSWRSRLYVKYLFQQIQTLLPEVAAPADVRLIPRSEADAAKVKLVEQVDAYDVHMDEWPTKRIDAIINVLVYGGCPVKSTWDYRKGCQYVRNPATGGVEKIPYLLAKRPTQEVVDPEDFLCDPTATRIQQAEYVFHRMVKSRRELDQLAALTDASGDPVYMNLDKLGDAARSKRSGLLSRVSSRIGRDDDQEPDGFEVVERWTPEYVTTVVNGELVIRHQPNPLLPGRIPFELMLSQRDPKNLYGISEVWTAKDIQEAIWTVQNAQMDALRLAITPPLALDSSEPSLERETWKPGARFFTRNPGNSVVVQRLQGVENFASDQAVQSLIGLMERTTGINASLSGMSNSSSATESVQDLQQAKTRVNMKLTHIAKAEARLMEMRHQLRMQFLDQVVQFAITGPDGEQQWMHAEPQEIVGLFEFRAADEADRAMKQLRIERADKAAEILMPLAGQPLDPQGTTVNMAAVVREVLLAREVKDLDRYFYQQPQEQQAPPDPREIVATNFKDMPADAQAAQLERIGLPAQGAANGEAQQQAPQGVVSAAS